MNYFYEQLAGAGVKGEIYFAPSVNQTSIFVDRGNKSWKRLLSQENYYKRR